MLGGGGVGLVFHLEHDGDVLHAVDMVAEDEVALCASAGVVVLLEIGVGVDAATDAVELRAAMDLEALADHLGRHSGLQILVIIHLLLLLLEAPLIVLLERILADGGLFLLQLDLVLQLLALALGLLQGLPPSLPFLEHFELHSVVVAFDLSLQTVDLLLLARQLCAKLQLLLLLHAVQLRFEACDGRVLLLQRDLPLLQGALVGLIGLQGRRRLLGLVLLVQLGNASVEVGLELAILDLHKDGRIVSLVHLECLLAIGTDQFLHLFVSSSIKSTDQFRAWIFMSSSRSSRAAASVRRRRSGTSTTRTVLISLRP